MLFDNHEKSLLLGRDVFDRLRQLYSADSLDGELAKLREEMHETIKSAVISHESRGGQEPQWDGRDCNSHRRLNCNRCWHSDLFTLECPREIIIQQLKGNSQLLALTSKWQAQNLDNRFDGVLLENSTSLTDKSCTPSPPTPRPLGEGSRSILPVPSPYGRGRG